MQDRSICFNLITLSKKIFQHEKLVHSNNGGGSLDVGLNHCLYLPAGDIVVYGCRRLEILIASTGSSYKIIYDFSTFIE